MNEASVSFGRLACEAPKVVALRPPTHVAASGTLDLKNPLGQLRITRDLWSEWAPDITDPELRVFGFLFRMTALYSRDHYHFTYREIGGGNPVCRGTGLKETAMRTALKGLSDKGFISIGDDRRSGLHITICTQRVKAEKPVATSKRLQEASYPPRDGEGVPPVTAREDTPVVARDIIEPVIEPNQNQQLVDADAPTAVRLLEDLEKGGTELPIREAEPFRLGPATRKPEGWPIRLATEPARGPIKEPSLSASAVEKTWRGAFAAGPQSHAVALKAWTIADKGKIGAALSKTWTGKPAQLHEFVSWAAGNWTRITTSVFGWMTKRLPPATPDLGFFLHHRERFLDAFNRNVIAAEREKLTSAEQHMAQKLIDDQGYTRDEALLEAARGRARADLRDEIAREKHEIALNHRAVTAMERNFVRRFGVKPLPHRGGQKAIPTPAPISIDVAAVGPLPLFDMPDWDENTYAPVPIAPGK